MRTADVLVIAAYIAGLVGIGLRFSFRQNTTDEYFVGGRSIPGWATGLSLLATIITSVTFIAYPGSAYAGDWSLMVPGLLFVGVLALVGRVIVPFFRHVVRMSVYEYFGHRFGQGVRLYASLAFAAGHFAKMAFVFYLLALTLAGMTGWPVQRIIVLTAAITIFYTLLGGIKAVVWSDVVQGFVLWAGILVSLGYLLFLPAQGPHAVLADAWEHGKMSLGSTALRFDQPTIAVLVIYGFFFYLQKYTADQTVVQRYLIAKSDKNALRGIALGAGLCVPVWAAFMLIGSLLWSFYRLTGEHLPSTVTKPDQVFPHFLLTHLPVGLAGLFIAALLGAAMAMLASDMNCFSVIATEDFYRLARPQSTDRELLRVGRVVVAACGMAAAGLAMQLAHSQGSALSLYYTLTSIVAGGLAGLFLLAFLVPRATRAGAVTGIIAGLLFTTWGVLTENGKILNLGRWNFTWHDYMLGALGHVVVLGTGVMASLMLPGTPRSSELTWQGWRRRSSSAQEVPVSNLSAPFTYSIDRES
jgi:SSS family solute:Na+ symporter